MNLVLSPTVIRPVSHVFLDLPNIRKGGLKGVLPQLRTLDWSVLAKHIGQYIAPNTRLEDMRAYMPLYGKKKEILRKFDDAFRSVGQAGFSIIPKYGNDIDSDITRDILLSVMRHEQTSILDGVRWYPLQVQHILVGGDHGYAETYEGLKEAYGTNLELNLRVYSWRDSLSERLRSLVGDAGVVYLDDIPEFEKFHLY